MNPNTIQCWKHQKEVSKLETDRALTVKPTPIEQGVLWEKEFFGVSNDMYGEPQYLNWQNAVAQVVEIQGHYNWDPRRPRTTKASEALDCVRSYLPPWMARKVGLFCSIGTALDRFHGVDGFFLIDDWLVTVDLATKMKTGDVKADFILAKNQSDVKLWRFCEEVANKFKKEMWR